MKKVTKHYDNLYKGSEITFGEGKPEPLVIELLEYLSFGNVLDLGAGDGRNSLFLALNNFDVEAVDISQKGIECLQKKATENNVSVDTCVCDISEYKFVGKYDCIISTFVLHHIPRLKALSIIEKMKKHTKSGGFNIIVAFTKDGDFFRKDPNTDNFYCKANDMKDIYDDWNIKKYSEKKARAYAVRPDGSAMFNVSAYLLAQKK